MLGHPRAPSLFAETTLKHAYLGNLAAVMSCAALIYGIRLNGSGLGRIGSLEPIWGGLTPATAVGNVDEMLAGNGAC